MPPVQILANLMVLLCLTQMYKFAWICTGKIVIGTMIVWFSLYSSFLTKLYGYYTDIF
jgi:hypothetical protein